MSADHLDLLALDDGDREDTLRTILATCGEHRLLETVTAQGPDWLEAVWTPAETGPWFRTDGRGRKLLLPGTMSTELAVQASEVLIYCLDGGRRDEDGVPVLARITQARCIGPVPPGARLTTRVRLRDRLGPAFYVDATVATEAAKVLTARLTFTATKAMTDWLQSPG